MLIEGVAIPPHKPNISMQEIIINEEGFFVKETNIRPIDNERVIRSFFDVEDKLALIPNAFAAQEHTFDLYHKGQDIYALTQLHTLQVNAEWAPADDGYVQMATKGTAGAVKATLSIDLDEVCPKQKWLLLIHKTTLYLAVYEGDNIYAPPLPNFWKENGKMCNGENYPSASNFRDHVNALVGFLMTAPYNDDLRDWAAIDKFLRAKLNEDGTLTHEPLPYDQEKIISGSHTEIFEHAIR